MLGFQLPSSAVPESGCCNSSRTLVISSSDSPISIILYLVFDIEELYFRDAESPAKCSKILRIPSASTPSAKRVVLALSAFIAESVIGATVAVSVDVGLGVGAGLGVGGGVGVVVGVGTGVGVAVGVGTDVGVGVDSAPLHARTKASTTRLIGRSSL